jgi:hypothetical protein
MNQPTSPEDYRNKVQEFSQRQRASSDRIVQLARSVVPVLKDRGCPHMAKEIEQELFQLDAIIDEFKALMDSDLTGFLTAMFPKERP